MPDIIRTGFPLRRCSWSYAPIVSGDRTRAMIRWLDSVCISRVAQKHGRGGTKVMSEAKRTINGT